MKSLMVQGTSSGAGKTTLVAALCRIFADRGYSVAPFKSQNMSNLSYATPDFEISRAQAVQAVAARCEITPDLNPILLKPLGNYYSTVLVRGKRYKRMHAGRYYAEFAMGRGLRTATDSLKRLGNRHDLVILEGAGSPAEINLQRYDIANMRMARAAGGAPVILVSDIDRGGSFASMAGTVALIGDRYRRLVGGFVFNRFRGDVAILKPGFRKLERITGIPVLGTVPMVADLALPGEDSLDVAAAAGPARFAWTRKNVARMDGELDRLAKTVGGALDIKRIEAMIG